jgi:hypothetical protein
VGTREDGRLAVRRLDSVEDVKPVGFRNYRWKSQDRNQRRSTLKEAKLHKINDEFEMVLKEAVVWRKWGNFPTISWGTGDYRHESQSSWRQVSPTRFDFGTCRIKFHSVTAEQILLVGTHYFWGLHIFNCRLVMQICDRNKLLLDLVILIIGKSRNMSWVQKLLNKILCQLLRNRRYYYLELI